MGTYEIPRDTKGEGRLFYIFSTKALIYTVVGILVGWILRWVLTLFGKGIPQIKGIMSGIGIALIVILGILGFVIGTFKIPSTDRFEITRKAGGLNIDKVLWESLKFKFMKKSKYYVYDTKELVREEIVKDEKDMQELEEKEEKARNEKKAQDAKNRRGYITNG